ncbi:MAG: hypothetical protein GWO24_08940, partial [Akkermansiaceae bacterium]|nr:hypothetical protein [Akkermansiaceae bacterium]
TPDLPQAVEDRPGWGERVDEGVFGDEESGPAGEAGDGFAYEAGEDDELFGTAEEDGENPVGGD